MLNSNFLNTNVASFGTGACPHHANTSSFPQMGLGASMGMEAQMISTMLTMMVTLMGMMAAKQMQLPSSPGYGAISGGSPGLNQFLGGNGAAPAASGGGQAPAASGDSAKASKQKTGNLVDMGGGKKLDSSVAGAVKQMMIDAKKDGVDLKITSAHRSHDEQKVLYQKYLNGTGNLAAKPGTSNHESGLAIDFTNTPGAYDWLAKNAGRYGLKNLPGEPWHYSPSGT